jgi:hypothetical protein
MAELTHQQARSISNRIRTAKFPVLKDLGKFVSVALSLARQTPGKRAEASLSPILSATVATTLPTTATGNFP